MISNALHCGRKRVAYVQPIRELRRVLGSRGVYVSLLPTVDRVWNAVLFRLGSQRRIRFTLANPNGRDMNALATLVREGKLRSMIDSVYPLNRIEDAMEKSRSGRARGKIIVVVKAGASS